MKKISKKTLMLALSLILCFTVSIGLTAAYFTDYESAKGGAVLKLSGQTSVTEEMDGNNKNVVISNTGETDMIVRVQAIGSNVTASNTSGWIKGDDGWWYWGEVLKGSATSGGPDSTDAIKFSVSFPSGAETDTDVIVVHEASRTVYDGSSLVAPNGWDETAVGQIALQ